MIFSAEREDLFEKVFFTFHDKPSGTIDGGKSLGRIYIRGYINFGFWAVKYMLASNFIFIRWVAIKFKMIVGRYVFYWLPLLFSEVA